MQSKTSELEKISKHMPVTDLSKTPMILGSRGSTGWSVTDMMCRFSSSIELPLYLCCKWQDLYAQEGNPKAQLIRITSFFHCGDARQLVS